MGKDQELCPLSRAPVLQSSRLAAAPGTRTHSPATFNISSAMYKLINFPPKHARALLILLINLQQFLWLSRLHCAESSISEHLHSSKFYSQLLPPLFPAHCHELYLCSTPHPTPLRTAELRTGVAAQTLLVGTEAEMVFAVTPTDVFVLCEKLALPAHLVFG